MVKKEKNNYGGKRDGAGRPCLPEGQKKEYKNITISLLAEDMTKLKSRAIAEGLTVSKLIKKYLID